MWYDHWEWENNETMDFNKSWEGIRFLGDISKGKEMQTTDKLWNEWKAEQTVRQSSEAISHHLWFWDINVKRDALLQKQEDNELVNLKPLPTAKPVNLPDGITAELYGDIAMLTEFVYTFQDLLLPKEKLYISTGTDCFHLFFFVAVCLVKIILLFFLL